MKKAHLHALSFASVLIITACGGGGGGGGTPAASSTPVATSSSSAAVSSSSSSVSSSSSSLSSAASSSSSLSSSSSSSGAAQTAIPFTNVGVHDPAVIKVGDTFYVFGSHLGAAKSTDLMTWTQMAGGFDNSNPRFNTVTSQFATALNWFKAPYVGNAPAAWAPDTIKLADGKYYFYYDICDNTSRAALGVMVADNIEGPYVDKGVFIRSGMWGQLSEDGVKNYDNAIHPNAVDPSVFFDKNGKLWMIYGSYSGGIFILAMDATTGLPVAGQGYGKRLMGNNNSRIEAPYVIYNPTTSYYYMFTTFGGLDANGGYNMRIARSVNADGPYLDANGKDMVDVKGAAGTIFRDSDYQPHGQKLMGNFLFANTTGETGTAYGYVSPGHNSAYYDSINNKYLAFFHTRFPSRGEQHEVRVHEFFFNEDGWPVLAPFRYAPLSLAANSPSATVTQAEVAGSYKYLNHGKDITATIVNSQTVALNADGTISGAVTGTWAHKGSNYIDITLATGGLFKGVLSRQYNSNANKFVVTFSAQSTGGVSIWGARTGN